MTLKIDEMIDRAFALRESKRVLEDQVKKLGKEIEQLQQDLLVRLNEVGTNYARGSLASASITETLVPQIDDWGKASAWILENDALYLVHRRISSGPWKELRDAGTDVPGVEPFTKVAISLRRLGD